MLSCHGTKSVWNIVERTLHLSFEKNNDSWTSASLQGPIVFERSLYPPPSRGFPPGIRTPFRSLVKKSPWSTPRGVHFPLQVIPPPHPLVPLWKGVRIPCIGSFPTGSTTSSRHYDIFVALRERVRLHRSTCCAFRRS